VTWFRREPESHRALPAPPSGMTAELLIRYSDEPWQSCGVLPVVFDEQPGRAVSQQLEWVAPGSGPKTVVADKLRVRDSSGEVAMKDQHLFSRYYSTPVIHGGSRLLADDAVVWKITRPSQEDT
jgi:hypothetical protein